ncbi:CapA family protein [Streptomyces sp. NPDC090108]|uniref:CapA family protein n=1 Tax=Streptomyces sp. NPDC090108 TaxID=3365947 RepID=UPI00380A4CA9
MIRSGGQRPRRRGERQETERERQRAVRRRVGAFGLAGTGVLVAAALVSRAGTAHTPSAGPARPAVRQTAVPRAGAPAAPRPLADVRIAAVGDVVMGSLPDDLPPDDGASFFEPVEDLLRGDVVLGNLEGTLTTGGSSKCEYIGGPNCFAFRAPPSYGHRLKQAGFTAMNVANNHIDDFGEEGRRDTFDALRSVGLPFTGRLGQITVQRVHGVRVALVGFAPDEGANDLTDIPAAKRLVARAAAAADLVVVTMHAGAEGSDRTHVEPGTEYFAGEDRGDSHRFSRAVIDAGADLVVGSGPHVMRGMEFYRGRLIAYSLGNFSGYKVLGLGGTLSTSGVLQVTLHADGSYASGRLRPTRIVPPGTPDQGGDAIGLVSSMSDEDFGPSAARISEEGTIEPPHPER